ncbi:MAG: twin-arginine translocase subunit TatC [Proteobacteria bacterium]|nr:twin-arginine translocase subunit TatC [Pseudomonadota bacterium]
MHDQPMTFVEHLEELRRRLIYSAIALVVCTVVAYLISDLLFAWLARPLVQAWRDAGLGQPKLHFANPIEPFATYIKVALLGGVFLAVPVIFYQLWCFVAPGLKPTERRYVIPFTLLSSAFFIGGAGFGYFVVFPLGFRFLLGFARADFGSLQRVFAAVGVTAGQGSLIALEPTLMMSEYFSLVWRLLVAFGAIFELPLLLCFLALAGVVTHGALWRWNPYFIIVAFVLGAVLTPTPDVLTQSMMALPLIALYNLGIGVAWLVARRRRAVPPGGGGAG